MLNGIYYNSGNGKCHTANNGSTASQSTCNFSGNGELPKGLDDTARKMLDNDVIWNLGGSNSYNDVTVEMFYERERGTNTGSSNTFQNVWTKENDGIYHNGLGLMYPSEAGMNICSQVSHL